MTDEETAVETGAVKNTADSQTSEIVNPPVAAGAQDGDSAANGDSVASDNSTVRDDAAAHDDSVANVALSPADAADSEANTDTDTDTDTDANTEANMDTDANTNADTNTDTNAESAAIRSPRRRAVVSFVRRSSHLDGRLARAWEQYAPQYLLHLPNGGRDLGIDPAYRFTRAEVLRLWGSDRPLVVEIGTGQGENVIAAAQREPNRNFLALEVYDPGVAHTLLRAGKEGLSNLRVAQVNAPELLAVCEEGLLDEVWTFFPDPWPKMKHHKRRIVQPALAANVHRALKAGGVWRIATDIDDYALHVHEVMDGAQGFENVGSVEVSLPTQHVGKGDADRAAEFPHAMFKESERFAGRVLTNFEKKGLDAGRTIHDFTYRAV